MTTLQDVFVMGIQDLYSAENQLVDALPKMAEAATDKKLKQGFEDHLKQTEEHVARLEELGEAQGIELEGETCEAMEGLISEGDEMITGGELEGAVLDAALIGAAQKVEHYEMAGYGTVIAQAKELGFDDAVKLLKKTLAEEKEADEKLTKLAESEVNEAANTGVEV